MTLPEPPEEEQEPSHKPDTLPGPDEEPKRTPRFGFYRGTASNTPDGKSEKNSPPPASSDEAPAVPQPVPDHPVRIPLEFSLKPGGQPTRPSRSSGQGGPPHYDKENKPARKFHDIVDAGKNAATDKNPPEEMTQKAPAFETPAKEAVKKTAPVRAPGKFHLLPNSELTHRAFWDVTGAISLVVNIILIVVLVLMALQLRNLQTSFLASSLNKKVDALFGGLYGNFVKMDQATIKTTIAVNADIPLNFNLPVTQNTEVLLTSDVYIPNAHVVINTGGLNINAQAAVTLPAGTSLPIALNLVIPVPSTIPISLQVPVTIPLNQTELHEPFAGLQTTLQPLYCTFNKNAQYPEGTYLCAEHDAPTPGTP
jgi:hypothetical protein